MKTRHLLYATTLALSVCTATLAAEPAVVRLTLTQEAAGPRIEPELYGLIAALSSSTHSTAIPIA